MTAKVGREDLPAQTQRGNDREKYLPAPPKSMQQHERRPIGWAFGIVQLHVPGLEASLNQARMFFTHERFSLKKEYSVGGATGVPARPPRPHEAGENARR